MDVLESLDQIAAWAGDHATALAWAFGLTLLLLLRRDVRGRVAVERRRRDEYDRGYAEQGRAALGLELTPSGLPELPAFSCIEGHSPRHSYHAKSGDIDVWVFEFDDGYEQQIRLQTVACLLGPPSSLPSFTVEPAGLFGPIAPVEFPDHPEFSSRYAVSAYNPQGADRADIAEVVSRPFREALAARPGLSLECMRDYLLVYRSGRLVPPPELPAFLSDALALYRLLGRSGAAGL